jgi:hypothetical protein
VLRRFAIGIVKARSHGSDAATIQRMARNARLVFDDLRLANIPRPPRQRNEVQIGTAG